VKPASSGGCVVWLTGRPSSGKSTLARSTLEALRARGNATCLLDGDAVRKALVPQPGYDDDGRQAFYATLANLAALLANQGLIVLVPATAHKRIYREHARSVAPRFIEVFVDTAAEEAARRDNKGLYAGARSGEIRNVPGADLPYEPPADPDVRACGGKDPAGVEQIVALANRASTSNQANPS
jgi:adenylylsulfate kinase